MKMSKAKYRNILNSASAPWNHQKINGGRVPKSVKNYGTWLMKNDPEMFNACYNEWSKPYSIPKSIEKDILELGEYASKANNKSKKIKKWMEAEDINSSDVYRQLGSLELSLVEPIELISAVLEYMNSKAGLISDNIRLNVAEEFSIIPCARYKKDGKYSAEEFRDGILTDKYLAAFGSGATLVIDLDRVYGFASSFLEEAFGGLQRKREENILDIIRFVSNDCPSYIDRIEGFVDDVLQNRKDMIDNE